MTLWLFLAIGGAAGAVARYTVAGAVQQRRGPGFPWGTLVVNTTGSFLLGVVVTGLADRPFGLQLGALLAVGFLGDFTTFSTFAYESIVLIRQRQWFRVLLYAAGSTSVAVAAVVAGMACGSALG